MGMWNDEKVQNQKVANEQQYQRRVWWKNDRMIINNKKKGRGFLYDVVDGLVWFSAWAMLYICVNARMFCYCSLNEKHEWWKWNDHTFRRRFFIRIRIVSEMLNEQSLGSPNDGNERGAAAGVRVERSQFICILVGVAVSSSCHCGMAVTSWRAAHRPQIHP